MDTLRKQVRRAQWRLTCQRFLRVITWCWFGCLIAVLPVAVVGRLNAWPIPMWSWFAAGVGAGTLLAIVWIVIKRVRPLDAAMEIDRRFHLKERVSSSLALQEFELESPAGQALISDAARRVDKIHLPEQFKLTLGRWSLLPIAPATILMAILLWVGPSTAHSTAHAKNEAQKQPKVSIQKLSQKLAEKKKALDKQGLDEAQQLLARLEKDVKDLDNASGLDRKQGLVKLNDLAKDLDRRREQLGGAQKLAKQLDQLKNMTQGPADKMAEAMRNGDFKQAQKELEKLARDLAKGDLDEAQRQELAKQLNQMQNKLNEMTKAHEEAKAKLEEQIKQLKEAGRDEEAENLKRQLEKLSAQDGNMRQLENMATKLSECSQSLEKGDTAEAVSRLEAMQADLSQLDREMQELETIEGALADIEQAKDSMTCKECNGEGCEACQGGNSRLSFKQQKGRGMGEGRGAGDRPEEATDSGYYDTRVRQKVGRGAAVVTDMVDGPNIKGAVQQEINEQFASERAEASDPLTDQQLPPAAREHAKNYFKTLREGR